MSEIRKLTEDLAIIQKLDDEPNDVGGLTAAELKAKFDEAGLNIQKYINDSLIPDILGLGSGSASYEVEVPPDKWEEDGGTWVQNVAVPNMSPSAAVVTLALSRSATDKMRAEYVGNILNAEQLNGALRLKMRRKPTQTILLLVGIS